MKHLLKLKLFSLVVLGITILWSSLCFADVKPGDVITKDNWQKIEGLVPDFILNDVKNGQNVMKIGEVKFNRLDFISEIERNNVKNPAAPKYDINEKGYLVAGDGKPYKAPILTRPFPVIDPADPKAGIKVMYNYWGFYLLSQCDFVFDMNLWLIDKNTHSQIVTRNWFSRLVKPNATHDFGMATLFVSPAATAGTASYSLVSFDNRNEKVTYVYIADSRSFRRMPGNIGMSEASSGKDYAADDEWPGGTWLNVYDTDYKFIRVTEVLAPYMSETPLPVEDSKSGGILIPAFQVGPKDGKPWNIVTGDRTPGWKGAPWAVTNAVWCKQKAYEIEWKVKPYVSGYRYGVGRSWVDPETCLLIYKGITDVNNKFFKSSIGIMAAGISPTGRKNIFTYGHLYIDYKRQHGTVTGWQAGDIHMKPGIVNPNLFTKSGFVEATR